MNLDCVLDDKSCFINIDTGNSSYTCPPDFAVASGDRCHDDNAICSITLTNPASYYNNRESVTLPRHDDDNVDDDTHDMSQSQGIRTIHFVLLYTAMGIYSSLATVWLSWGLADMVWASRLVTFSCAPVDCQYTI